MRIRQLLGIVAGVVLSAAVPRTLWACSVCGGDPAAPMSQGMSMGILTLMIITGMLLSAFVTFFMFLRMRAKACAQSAALDLSHGTDEEAIV